MLPTSTLYNARPGWEAYGKTTATLVRKNYKVLLYIHTTKSLDPAASDSLIANMIFGVSSDCPWQDIPTVGIKHPTSSTCTRPDVRIVSTGLDSENTEILQAVGYDSQDREVVVDILCNSEGVTLFLHPCIDSTSTHGTGCTLSASLASQLGLEKSGAHKWRCAACPSQTL